MIIREFDYECPTHGWFTEQILTESVPQYLPCHQCGTLCERGFPIGTRLNFINDEVPGGKIHPTVGYYETKSELARKTDEQGRYDRRSFGERGGREAFQKYCANRKKERFEAGMKKINEGIEKMVHEMPEQELRRQIDNQIKATPDKVLAPKGAFD